MLVRRAVAGTLVILSLCASLALAVAWSSGWIVGFGTLVAVLGLVLATGAAQPLLAEVRALKADHTTEQTVPPTPSLDDLVGVLRDTLMLARSIRTDLRLELVDVPALLAHVARKYPSLAVGFAGPPRALIAQGDPRALRHAFDILIDNAYASGRRVALECDSGVSFLLVHIDDDGPGIPRVLRQRVFERQFYMSTPPSARRGCSAALVIAHQNARALGGTLSVGASPMGGARFTLRLPLLEAATRHAADPAPTQAEAA